MIKILLSDITKVIKRIAIVWLFLELIPYPIFASWHEGSRLYTREGITIIITEKNTSESGQASLFFPLLNEYFQVRFDSLEVQGFDEVVSGEFCSTVISFDRPSTVYELEKLADFGCKSGVLPRLLNEHLAMKQVRLDDHLLFLNGFSIQNGITSLSMSMILNTPEDDILVFDNSKVIFDNLGGISWCGTKFFLSNETPVNNNELPFTIKGSSDKSKASAIEFDCNGFKSFRFFCEYRFDRRKFIPVKTSANTMDTVAGNFIFESDTLWQFIGKINIDAFELADMPGFQFGVENAVVDLDTRKNDDGLAALIKSDSDLKEAYNTIDNTWQGFFMKELLLKLPPGFGKSANSESFTLSIKNLMADASGASGVVAANPGLPQASTAGWGISLDSINLKFVQNAFKNSFINGKINIPIMKGDLKYQAQFIYKNKALEMGLTLTMDGVYSLPMIPNTSLTLSTSTAGITYKDKKFTPQATLNGTLTVKIDLPKVPKLEISLLGFENLKINDSAIPQSPNLSNTVTGGLDRISIGVFRIGNFTTNSGGSSSSAIKTGVASNTDVSQPTPINSTTTNSTNPKVSNFPFFIKDLKFGSRSKNNKTQYGLSFTTGVNVMEGKMTAAGLFSVWADLNYSKLIPGSTPYNPWEAINFSSFDWDGMYVKSDIGALSLEGALVFFSGDATWGDGFKAALEMKIKGGLDMSIWCTSQFGTKAGGNDRFRYFFADARFVTSAGIPLGPVSIHGFSGGFFYNMVEDGAPGGTVERAGKMNPNSVSTPTMESASKLSTSLALGVTGSGARYKPQEGIVSFKAGIVMAILNSPQVLTADVEFGMVFNTNNTGLGLNEVYFNGNGYSMSRSIVTRKSAPITQCVKLKYNHITKIISGNLGANINLANGFVTGGYNNSCSITNIYCNINNKQFYFYFGLPPLNSRFNVATNVLGIKNSSSAYFAVVAGYFPNLPAQMLSPAESLGPLYSGHSFPTISQPLSQSPNSVSTLGVNFGTRINTSANFNFVNVFSGKFDATLGADVQIRYNPNLNCGQNGWFFEGQVYAGVLIKMDMLGMQLMDARAMAALTVKFPNPFFAQGVVSGKWTAVGGKISGCFYLPLKIGNDCSVSNYQVQSSDSRIKYGDIVRIKHWSTGKSLRAFNSKDEVAAYSFDNDRNYEWLVEPCYWCGCMEKQVYVNSGEKVRLLNIWTGKYLEATGWAANSTRVGYWDWGKWKEKTPDGMSDRSNNQYKAQRNGSTLGTNIEWVIGQDGGGVLNTNNRFRLVTPGGERLHSHPIFYRSSKWGNLNNNQEVTVWRNLDDNDWWIIDFKK